jgi:hypothetical protein
MKNGVFSIKQGEWMMKNKNVDLDNCVSLSVSFKDSKSHSGDVIKGMRFHLADDNYGVEWYPTKKAIGKLITVLQELEGQMTDETNAEHDDE